MGRQRIRPAVHHAVKEANRLWTPNTATSGGFRPAMWHKADSLQLANGAAVAAWNDESGNLRHATQATSGFRPTLVANAINGKPAVRFDGTDDRLVLANAQNLARNIGGIAIIVVRKAAVLESRPMTVTAVWLPGPAVQLNLDVSVANQDVVIAKRITANAATTVTVAGTTNIANYQIHVASVNFSTAAIAYYIGGVSVATGTLLSSGLTADIASSYDPRIGSLPGDLEFWEGDIAELIVYNTTALSVGDRRQVETYLSQKYGIAIT